MAALKPRPRNEQKSASGSHVIGKIRVAQLVGHQLPRCSIGGGSVLDLLASCERSLRDFAGLSQERRRSGDHSDCWSRQLLADYRASIKVVVATAIAEIVDDHVPFGVTRKRVTAARTEQAREEQLVARVGSACPQFEIGAPLGEGCQVGPRRHVGEDPSA